ncbi:ATP-binding cassette domain-containing protein (plasmid) [Sinorhizobium meliloti]|nr:ATP-binding cassette domain-containing protein [Sinorhizobium meliloti]
MSEAILDICSVSKRFGDNLANDEISLSLGKGEIVALLGENGAGKTTLMSILFGHYVPDSGKVLVEGRELPPGKPRAAIRAGIGMVHQHFSLGSQPDGAWETSWPARNAYGSCDPGTGAARRKLRGIWQRFGLTVGRTRASATSRSASSSRRRDPEGALQRWHSWCSTSRRRC